MWHVHRLRSMWTASLHRSALPGGEEHWRPPVVQRRDHFARSKEGRRRHIGFVQVQQPVTFCHTRHRQGDVVMSFWAPSDMNHTLHWNMFVCVTCVVYCWLCGSWWRRRCSSEAPTHGPCRVPPSQASLRSNGTHRPMGVKGSTSLN